ncbi:hypothetical protein AYO43_00470 [Nitrospira sp. SCGC AG-212-E16]|nr:hypothetical protein AYO43_00470 [Nitrospira sp. SCGC AG-212-E16]
MYRVVFLALILSIFPQPVPVGAEGFGPFPVRNFQAFQQLVLSLPGDRAAVVRPGTLDVRLELAETASVYNENSPPTTVTVKFETLRSGLFLRYGATKKLELGLEVPVLYRYQGFMNGAITTTERATTGINPARDALKNSNFVFNVNRNGQTIMNGGPGAAGLGDTTLMSKYQLLTEGATMPAVSLRGAVKLPTGNQADFFGSGSPDFGLGLAVEKLVAGRWMLYANMTGVVPTGTIAGFGLRPTFSGLAAIEYLWSENLSITTHFDYYSSPFHGTGAQAFDQGVTESVLGFNYRVAPHFLWQVYAVENLDFIEGSAADFTLSTVFTYRFESGSSRS